MMLKALCKRGQNRVTVTFSKTDDNYYMISYCKKILKILLSHSTKDYPVRFLVSLAITKATTNLLDDKQ